MAAMLHTILLLALLAAPAAAQTLRIGMAAETDGADPHHFAMTPNSTLRDHVFEELVFANPQSAVIPALATHWERLDDLTWRFHLRTTARFSDGARFGAPDVVATFCRILNNRDELGASFSPTIRRIAAVEPAGDPGREDTVIIRTVQPEPLLLTDLRGIAIIPRTATPPGRAFDRATACGGGEGWPGIADFNALRIPGTGPFRVTGYTRSGTITLERNPHYDGPKPHWAEVRLTPITQQAARMASLLAGDQDVIEAPGTPDIPRLRADPRFRVTAAPTLRLLFLQMDVARDPTPFVPGRNLLRDPRVRQALSLAINRTALVDRIMDGNALPASNYLPTGMPGTLPGAPVLPYDPARARALLKDAGAEGMTLTLHATNNRYVNDSAIAQAIVQQWQRVGIKAAVETMPAVTFFSRRSRKELSVYMGGWATAAPETLGFFRSWLSTTDEARGVGSSNYGGWSDPAFDTPVRAAMATMDDAARAALLRQASARALDQMPAIPLYFENAVWATRAGLHYPGRTGEITVSTEITEIAK